MAIIELDSIDSTNNYAMQLIDADKARHGLTITARTQTHGKGQRGKSWAGTPGESLLMSMIIIPEALISGQAAFNAAIAVAVADVLKQLYSKWRVYIKWPNDIIINDKKAGGILIENVLRGNKWAYSVIGLGLNILQRDFPAELPNATSLALSSGMEFDLPELILLVRERILKNISALLLPEAIKKYNQYLYKRNEKQAFSNAYEQWEVTIIDADSQGVLNVQLEDGTQTGYYHGQAMWEW